MPKEVLAALLGAAGGLISSALLLWTMLRSKMMEQATEREKLWVIAYDTKLLEARLVDYRKLWALTKAASRSHIQDLNPERARSLAADMTDWYYEGGLLLSALARHEFSTARELLERVDRGSPRSSERWEHDVLRSFGDLRTALCEDLNSRRGPTLIFREEPSTEEEAKAETMMLRRLPD